MSHLPEMPLSQCKMDRSNVFAVDSGGNMPAPVPVWNGVFSIAILNTRQPRAHRRLKWLFWVEPCWLFALRPLQSCKATVIQVALRWKSPRCKTTDPIVPDRLCLYNTGNPASWTCIYTEMPLLWMYNILSCMLISKWHIINTRYIRMLSAKVPCWHGIGKTICNSRLFAPDSGENRLVHVAVWNGVFSTANLNRI